MLYRKLRNTDIELSALGFGCMRLPVIDNKLDRIDYPHATRLLHYAIDNGINFVDTAYFYHAPVFGQRGQSEPFVGEALSGGWREKVYLATKMPLLHLREKGQMEAFLTEQLQRLKTDYLDFYLLHALNGELWDKMLSLGVREFLDKKVAEGKIRFPAFSFHGSADDFKRICDGYNWTYAQIQYNYMDIDFQAGYKGLQYAAAKGINVVVMEPLKGGKLAQNILPEMTSVIEAAEVKRSPAMQSPRESRSSTDARACRQGTGQLGLVRQALLEPALARGHRDRVEVATALARRDGEVVDLDDARQVLADRVPANEPHVVTF